MNALFDAENIYDKKRAGIPAVKHDIARYNAAIDSPLNHLQSQFQFAVMFGLVAAQPAACSGISYDLGTLGVPLLSESIRKIKRKKPWGVNKSRVTMQYPRTDRPRL